MAGGIAWLLPAALLALAAGLWFTRRAPRTDRGRAALVIRGGWLLVTAVVFSFMGGIIRPYYTVALAPAVGALVGTAVVQLWRLRTDPATAGLLSGGLALTAVTTYVLLIQEPSWQPWLASAVLAVGLLRGSGVLRQPAGARFGGGRAGDAAGGLGCVLDRDGGDSAQRGDSGGGPFGRARFRWARFRRWIRLRRRRRLRWGAVAGWPVVSSARRHPART